MATTAEQSAQLVYGPNVQHNASLVTVKFISSCFSGAVAGILGLQNWLGFALFALSTLLTSACVSIVNCKGKPARYLPGGWSELLNPGQENVFSFILVWTMFFGEYCSIGCEPFDKPEYRHTRHLQASYTVSSWPSHLTILWDSSLTISSSL